MSFRDSRLLLRDIADAVATIQDFTSGMVFEGFREDSKTIAAVERKLLVISETAIRLGEQAPILCSGVPWPKIRGIGNWIRHANERLISRVSGIRYGRSHAPQGIHASGAGTDQAKEATGFGFSNRPASPASTGHNNIHKIHSPVIDTAQVA